MERNRVIPELIGLYNVENEVHKLLPNDTKYTTKLIGAHNKRVLTAFNPSDAIQWNAEQLDQLSVKRDLIGGKNNNINKELTDIASSDASNTRENLDEPLHWDQNWTWDF